MFSLIFKHKKKSWKKVSIIFTHFHRQIKKYFSSCQQFSTFFHTWKNKQNWQTHFPEQKKKKKKMNFVSQKKLSWQNFFHSVSRFHRQRRKLGNFFILRKIFYSCKQVQNFLKTFFHTWKINFPRRKKVLLKYTVFTQFQTWKKFLNFIFFKPSVCFRRTFFSFLKLRKKNFPDFFLFYVWNQVECFF